MGDPTIPPRSLNGVPAAVRADETLAFEGDVETVLRARSAQQSLLVEVNASLAAAIDVEDAFAPILARLVERVGLVNASIHLFDEGANCLRCVAHSGMEHVEAIGTLARDGPGLIPWVARTGQPLYSPDVSKELRYPSDDFRTQAEYAVPLTAGGRLLGVLDIESGRVDGIRAVTRKLLDQFAGQAALAIERSELYKKLRASERRLRSIFEQSHLGAGLCDLEGRCKTVNPALALLLECPPEELTGSSFLEVVHPSDRKECEEQIRHLVEGRAERCIHEARLMRKSGAAVSCTVIVSVIRDTSGGPSNLLIIVQDITERKRAEAERERLQEQLFQAQRMKALGTLAGGIAHDFNNLLGVISGYASLLRLRLGRQDPLQHMVHSMEQSAERAAGLARQLLQFSRQERPQLRPIPIAGPLANVLKLVEQTFDRRIHVVAELAPDLPAVEGDAGALELALLNLCINARDAMPEGGTLTLAASVVTLDHADLAADAPGPPGEYVRIVVRDTGVGLESGIMDRIFEPFFTTKERGKGAGLGLAMVYGTVLSHNGFIGVRSQKGEGAEFVMHLPVSTRRPAEEVEHEGTRTAPGRGTVLVVDDEPLMLDFACEAVRELGYGALAATEGAQACAIFAENYPHIKAILLDMVMPGTSWEAIIEAILTTDPHARIIVASGYNGSREAQRVLEAGAVAFIGKPYTVDELGRVLQKALSNDPTD